jgi:hypothetical protein
MLNPELLSLLCCPVCKGDLAYDVKAERLTCARCGRVYPVKNNIPVLLPDDERPADSR